MVCEPQFWIRYIICFVKIRCLTIFKKLCDLFEILYICYCGFQVIGIGLWFSVYKTTIGLTINSILFSDQIIPQR